MALVAITDISWSVSAPHNSLFGYIASGTTSFVMFGKLASLTLLHAIVMGIVADCPFLFNCLYPRQLLLKFITIF